MDTYCNYFFQKKTFASHFQGLPYIWEDANKGIYIEEYGTLLIPSKDVSNNVPVGIDYSDGNDNHPKPVCFTFPESTDYLLEL